MDMTAYDNAAAMTTMNTISITTTSNMTITKTMSKTVTIRKNLKELGFDV